jgi:SAM-dependent methyltransferase
MHPTAWHNCKCFFDTYAAAFQRPGTRIVEIGSLDVNGNLRGCCAYPFEYTGVDFVDGKGVDVVLQDPYSLPFDDNSADIVISSSCFEHSEMFWVLFLEIMRILKPDGLFYLNVPSNGDFHRYPVDCWRFYPDSGRALVTWARRNGMKPVLLESYTNVQADAQWNDCVAVFVKDENLALRHPNRILTTKRDYYNGVLLGSDGYLNPSILPEDRVKLLTIKQIIDNQLKITPR